MTVSILISLIATLALWLPVNSHSLALFYVMVPIFGFGSGSVMSLAPVCIGELAKVSEYGQRYGTSYSVVGIAYVSPFFSFWDGEVADVIGPSFLFPSLPSYKLRLARRRSSPSVVGCWFWRWRRFLWRAGRFWIIAGRGRLRFSWVLLACVLSGYQVG